mmetsp:Transcript_37556/g.86740  ORF Transcript_37556/g.86740 Transcript_37556/m.86740 type:complete len:643 (+) Transcript_37556:73-2001(+)
MAFAPHYAPSTVPSPLVQHAGSVPLVAHAHCRPPVTKAADASPATLPTGELTHFAVGTQVEIWSETEKRFLLGQVHERRGSVVVVRYLHPSSGASVEKGVDLAHSPGSLRPLAGRRASSASEPVRHFAPQPRIVARDDSGATRAYDSSGEAGHHRVHKGVHRYVQIRNGAGRERLACAKGCSCKDRDGAHLHDMAHPFDDDYAYACARSGVHPEEQTLRGLFCWIDVDDSGKISREEFEQALPQLSHLIGADFSLSAEAWHVLDEDGNGVINFSEFAEWAGAHFLRPLPLGVRHLFKKRSTTLDMGTKVCRIVGCPCEGYVEMSAGQKRQSLLARAFAVGKGAMPEVALRALGDESAMRLCACGHKLSAHAARRPTEGEVPYPDYWSTPALGEREFQEILETGPDRMSLFQHIFDQTYRPVWTRDRRRHNPSSPNVPQRFVVTKVFRVENSKLWREFVVRRQLLLDTSDKARETDPTALPLYTDIKTVAAWQSFPGAGGPRLEKNCNEWYLLHGTSPSAARTISESDFKINLAGSNTGTLYGRGAYFAESITKADEYAKQDSEGNFAVLLCRVLGGHVLYTDQVDPNAEELCRLCSAGEYDCVLGDRETSRNTYREFVVFDTEDVYPEYIVHYRRVGEIAKP